MHKHGSHRRWSWQSTLFSWTWPARRVRRLVRRAVGSRRHRLQHVDPAAVTVAALQMRADPVTDPAEYVLRVVKLAREAVGAEAQLLVFPAYSAAPLWGLFPQIEGAAGNGARGESLVLPGSFLAHKIIGRLYRLIFSELALSLGVYVHAGSALLPGPAGRLANTALMFNPAGRLIARQHKLHLLPSEAGAGLQRGRQVTTAQTVLGRAGMAFGTDVNCWEVFRSLYLAGTDFALIPTASLEGSRPADQEARLWPRLQESPMFGLQSCLVGNLGSLQLTGRSAVLGPWQLSPAGNGLWARVEDDESQGVAVAEVNLQALHQFRSEQGLDRAFNPLLYARYQAELSAQGPPAPATPVVSPEAAAISPSSLF